MTAHDNVTDLPGQVTRRAVLGGALGAASTLLIAPANRAEARPSGPPAFGTARSQFTLLAPVKLVPPLPLTRPGGTSTNFAAFRGKVVLVNFWATWCAACRIELPILDRLQETHKNLKVVAIALDRDGRSVVPFVQKLKLRHLDIYLDPEGRIGSLGNDNAQAPFPIYGMPISYIVGRGGGIEGYVTGEADWLSDDARHLLNYYTAQG